MVNMAHNRHDWRTTFEILRIILNAFKTDFNVSF